jgi:son of sevenless
MGQLADPPSNQVNSQSKWPTFAAAFECREMNENSSLRPPSEQVADEAADYESLSYQRHRSQRSLGINGYTATPDPPPALYVRALYNYDADDRTSLSFRQGDTIQVLTQLESGWWDGVINDVRGWFPSNYCAIISGPEDLGEYDANGQDESEASAESGTDDELDEEQDDDLDSEGNLRDGDEDSGLPIEGAESEDQGEAAYWIPQATPDGRLFYFNTMTGVSTMELPLETPTSTNDTGPQDRTNFFVPDQTRAPPELLGRGYNVDRDDQDASGSEGEGESLMLASNGVLPRKRQSSNSDGVSSATSLDSVNASPVAQFRQAPESFHNSNGAMNAVNQAPGGVETAGETANSFSATSIDLPTDEGVPRYFFDDGTTIPTTWDLLINNMRQSVASYRQAVRNHERAEFVRRAEDISDHLRILLAAGSGTTDNHSGNPSIISTNKALYPHFRDMMSRFSKLVLSSHIAAADWPGPDASAKCLQEAEGVLHGVYGYVEVARQQRGEHIPRLVPGFILNSTAGGNWQNNNVDARDPTSATSFKEQDDIERRVGPLSLLDAKLLGRVDEARRSLNANIRRLEDQLHVTEKVITRARQNQLGGTICLAAGSVIDSFKPFISIVESADLGHLGPTFQSPQLLDFSSQKQQAYDNVAEFVLSCQSVTANLPDEWAEIRSPSLDERLARVAAICRQFESNVSQIVYSLQLLRDTNTSHDTFKEVRLPDAEANQKIPVHTNPPQGGARRLQQAAVGPASPYDHINGGPDKTRRLDHTDKPSRFFGQMPPPDVAPRPVGQEPISAMEENPWFLRLDHPNEIFHDTKSNPPQLKHGTLTGLVEQLTRHDRLDAVFNGTFLLTYRSFTTAEELFGLLVRRFSIQPPPGISQQDLATWEDKKQKLVRFRVVNVLKSWLEHYWMEGNDEKSRMLLERIYSFAKDSIATTKTPGSGPLMAVVDQRLKGQDTSAKRLVLTLTNSAPAPILPKNMKKLKFLDIDATEFARQLTIIESKLYGKIKSTECLGKTWQKKVAPEEPDPAPNVKALILHSNQLTNWVAEMILSQSEVKKRVVVIKHFVSIADVSLVFTVKCTHTDQHRNAGY